MKVVELVATAVISIIVWSLQLAPSAWAQITFDIGSSTKNSYSTFLTTMRNQVKDPKLVYYDIPMLPKPINPPNYLLVVLQASQDVAITIAINRNDLYVVGYMDMYEGKYRAHFFPDAPSNAKTTLFPEAKPPLRLTINYKSTYPGLESKAGTRRKVGLGIQKLTNYIGKVNDNAVKDQTEATFLLLSVQMISEAARFKYIEKQVLDNFATFEFTPDYKVLSLENEWGKISTAIKKSKDGNISPPLQLKDANDKPWQVTKVSEIKPDMALLKYVADGLASQIITYLFQAADI